METQEGELLRSQLGVLKFEDETQVPEEAKHKIMMLIVMSCSLE